MTRKAASAHAATLSVSGAWMVVSGFVLLFAVLSARIGHLAMDSVAPASAPVEVAEAPRTGRADIVDRNGHLLATTVPVWSLYAHPREIGDANGVVSRLAEIVGNLDSESLAQRLAGDRPFVWVSRRITPEQKRRVLALGAPGLYFGRRSSRVYPTGGELAHVLGGVRMDKEGVDYAELVGVGGVEGRMDQRLRGGGAPLKLTIDLPAQTALRRILARHMAEQRAKGAAAVLMEIGTGAVRAMVSLPDYDPNRSGAAAGSEAQFNRAAQGVYELGSVLKPLTLALALDQGVASLDTVYDIDESLKVDGHSIGDPYIAEPQVTLHEAVYRSSNIATAKAALQVGGPTQKVFMDALGLLDPLPLQISEASGSQPLYPRRWRRSSTATIAYGHGIAITPVHLAAAYATLAGDGRRVSPTLLEGEDAARPRVVSEATAKQTRRALRSVVERGTGRRAEVAGYQVGGKTGTADKHAAGGYSSRRVVATFAAVFPGDQPTHVLLVMLDEPDGRQDVKDMYRRTAGHTAAPAAAEAIRRLGPLLGVLPRPDPNSRDQAPTVPELRVAQR